MESKRKDENRCCGACSYFYHDNEMLEDDHVCVNHKSDHVADYVFENDGCEYWKGNSHKGDR